MALENSNGHGVYAVEAKVEEQVSMGLESLKVLEGRVEDVLTRHTTVCTERDALRRELSEVKARLAEMTARLDGIEKERAQIRARVESILGRLEGLDLS
jgi:chromosome segregation ATPase